MSILKCTFTHAMFQLLEFPKRLVYPSNDMTLMDMTAEWCNNLSRTALANVTDPNESISIGIYPISSIECGEVTQIDFVEK